MGVFGAKWLILVLGLLVSAFSWSANPIYINASSKLAIDGYDPVSYFTESKAVEGVADHALNWQGATWHFSSAENKALFESDPEKYAPQYGGYCAYAVSINKLYKIDPHQFTVMNDKLYLNLNHSTLKKWRKAPEKYIEKANANWPALLDR